MGIIDQACAVVGGRSAPTALALASLLAACAHIPPLIDSRDALSPLEHVRLGTSYEAQGLRADAVGQYEAAVRRDPACAEGWLALGDVAFMDGRLKEAEKDFRKALRASPHSPGAGNNLAMVILARGGSLPQAEALAQDALRQGGPLRPYILDTLANIYLRESRYADAAAAVGQAEAATPPDSPLVRDQLLATRNGIKSAVAAHDRVPAELQR